MLLVAALITVLPGRYQLAPAWLSYAAIATVIASMLLVTIFQQRARFRRIERIVVLVIVPLAEMGNVISASKLIADMINHHHNYSSVVLLQSAAVIWTLNVALTAFLYWRLDRGGPEGRQGDVFTTHDFEFADEPDAPDRRKRPGFLDYSYVAFAVSTAFILPDYMRPASGRAKVITMGQALVSLATLFLIAARAVSTLS